MPARRDADSQFHVTVCDTREHCNKTTSIFQIFKWTFISVAYIKHFSSRCPPEQQKHKGLHDQLNAQLVWNVQPAKTG